MKLVVYAVNVHHGGGGALLNPLISAIDSNKNGPSSVVFLDTRLNLSESLSTKIQVNRVTPNILNRLLAEQTLKRIVEPDDVVLSFGNLPPIFNLNAKCILFIQNRYLIDEISLEHFNIKTRLRITVERLWLKLFCKNVDKIIVQTPSMQSCVSKHLGRVAEVIPYIDDVNTFSRSLTKRKDTETKYDFIYVASGEPHKNHKQLVEAWVLLATEGIYPVLCLTLSDQNSNELVSWISNLVKAHNLKIVNVGFVASSVVAELYIQARAMIYPSTLESFGLPLIEARNANLAIVASELDYVRDIIDPEETFDPSSPKSIARAVKRFFGYVENDLPLVDPKSFLDFCINQ